jgi:hypothetical protein
MSFFSQLNKPPLVLGAGAAVLGALPFVTMSASTASLASLGMSNLAAFVINVAAVSVPGRIDGQAQEEMMVKDKTYQSVYSPGKGRSLVAPAGWA